MDILDKNKYIEFSHILSGCRTITDAYYFAEMYIKTNPEMATLVYSMINGKRYDQVLDFKTIKTTLESTNNQKYKEDAFEYSDNFTQKTFDTTQKKSLNRIIKDKPHKPVDIQKVKKPKESEFLNITFASKPCPHCGAIATCDINTKYTICGYSNSLTGYDWKGCGKDWCFECGKMLCKSWEVNTLLLPTNRHHNTECCLFHSIANNKDFINSYCQCTNNNVNRHSNKEQIDFDLKF